ncbi:MAG: family 43 glycosylhydrolase [Lachnospiraceae bacterium]|nr:family 43 glycosylhydrolase [Lachnospiraceae bacterium]
MKNSWSKKLLALTMAGAMVLSTGCGAQEPVSSQENGESSTVESTPTEEKEKAVVGDKSLVTGDISRVSVHDPSIFVEIDDNNEVTYYLFGTHITSAKSKNLVDWKTFTNGYAKTNNTHYGDLSANLHESFLWAGENDADCKGGFAVWAPDVYYNEDYVNEDGSKGAYMIYYSASSTYCRSAIGYAISDTVEGPYEYRGTVVYSGFTQTGGKDKNSDVDKTWTNTNIDELMAEGRIEGEYNTKWGTDRYNTSYAPNAIDPTIFKDTEGKLWMCYGSWSGGIYLLEIDPVTGDAIYPGKDGTTEDGRVIDKYFGTRIAGGHTKSGEGPFILYDEETEYYYLYTTYNYLDSVSGYNMRLFRSKTPQGPYLDAMGNNAVFENGNVNMYQKGIKVMGNYTLTHVEQGYRSPGHCSAFIDGDGQRYLIYHTRFEDRGEHFEVRVHQQFMNEDGWPVTAVFENRNDTISQTGYESSEIVGVYELLNHGTGSDGAGVRIPEIVVLMEDGTITGDYTGTWEEKEGSYFATFVIGDVTYKGVFFKQHHELKESAEVMTFTAIGENNETIWGVKYAEGTTYVPREIKEKGMPTSDFETIDIEPILLYTFDNADELELAGEAKVEDGVLHLATSESSYHETYAVLPDLTGYDFSKGITIAADVLVSKYATDWTPLFMLGDGKVGEGCQSLAYHFTQGFSSVTDDANNEKTGYYGVDISKPYTWDYFASESMRHTWYHIAVTIREDRMATYVDGKQVQFVEGDFSTIMDTFKVATGNYLGGSYYNDPDFSGKMDNVAIYNTYLAKDEVGWISGK